MVERESNMMTSVSPVWLETPGPEPEVVEALATPLVSLVYFHEALMADVTLEQAHHALGEWRVAFMPVVDAGRRPVGLCSREQIGHLLGSRFGFSLFSGARVAETLVPKPLIVSQSLGVREVIERALSRRGAAFGEDVILTDERGELVGLIRVEVLAQVQSRIVAEQMAALRLQHESQRRQTLDLFQVNHALRQSQGLYLALFENHALGVALLDLHGTIQAHNRRFAALLRIDNASGLVLLSLTGWIVEKDRAGFIRLLHACECGDTFAPIQEFTAHVPGLGARLFRCSAGWVRETGQVCVCLDDISEQRVVERQMALRDKQTLLESLVGGIAHELNNKLTPVQGFAELLEQNAAGHMQAYPRLISQSVMEAARIVRQLRELAAPSTVESRMVDLRKVVEESLVMMRFQSRDARYRLQTEMPPAPAWVMADAGQLKQVMMNLILNAVDAMKGVAGDPVLTVELLTDGQAHRLRVGDTGVGIPPENLRRIFDPFFTTKGPDQGTGLGLSICFSIVRQHGGEISVESELGEGTVFTVSLPVSAAVEPAVLVAEPLDPSGARAAWRKAALAARVLVVDDEAVLRHLLQEQLRGIFGCRVELAANGAEALELAGQTRFDLIVADLLMPVMGGREFYLKLQEKSPESARRVVFVTGYAGGNEVDAEMTQWGRPVILKPFAKSRLEEVCRPYLDLTGEESGGRVNGAAGRDHSTRK